MLSDSYVDDANQQIRSTMYYVCSVYPFTMPKTKKTEKNFHCYVHFVFVLFRKLLLTKEKK